MQVYLRHPNSREGSSGTTRRFGGLWTYVQNCSSLLWCALTGSASVQEIVLVALSVILSQIEFEKVQVIDVIRQVQLDAGKYIKKVGVCAGDSSHADLQRCGQVGDLIQQNLLAKAMQTARSRLVGCLSLNIGPS